uniref:Uncharacterized protein n=1 Tax=Anopheles minimus TaxID=112268 RepID=A0A182WET0_9DIPT
MLICCDKRNPNRSIENRKRKEKKNNAQAIVEVCENAIESTEKAKQTRKKSLKNFQIKHLTVSVNAVFSVLFYLYSWLVVIYLFVLCCFVIVFKCLSILLFYLVVTFVLFILLFLIFIFSSLSLPLYSTILSFHMKIKPFKINPINTFHIAQ